mmetsp:Transcript_13634/g.23355  ORF Transcript_13634/g.23355 Transcript_13634/m.23355 type:complete len:123 (-) Transcript_13634:187-555(-)
MPSTTDKVIFLFRFLCFSWSSPFRLVFLVLFEQVWFLHTPEPPPATAMVGQVPLCNKRSMSHGICVSGAVGPGEVTLTTVLPDVLYGTPTPTCIHGSAVSCLQRTLCCSGITCTIGSFALCF